MQCTVCIFFLRIKRASCFSAASSNKSHYTSKLFNVASYSSQLTVSASQATRTRLFSYVAAIFAVLRKLKNKRNIEVCQVVNHFYFCLGSICVSMKSPNAKTF